MKPLKLYHVILRGSHDNWKQCLRKKTLFKNYKRHGYQLADKIRRDNFRKECLETIERSKLNYIRNLGNKLADPRTSQKSYWKTFNKVMNKCKAPRIPPLLINNKFVINCKEKAKLFTQFFSEQCRPVNNDSCSSWLFISYKSKIRWHSINLWIHTLPDSWSECKQI